MRSVNWSLSLTGRCRVISLSIMKRHDKTKVFRVGASVDVNHSANGLGLTAPYATATFLNPMGEFHHVAEGNMSTITRDPARPSQATNGCKPASQVDDWLVLPHR